MSIKYKIIGMGSWIKKYSKAHIFYMIVLIVLGGLQFAQFTGLGTVYSLTIINKNQLSHQKEKNLSNRTEDKEKLAQRLEEERLFFAIKVKNLESKFNSKIDILDSAIKPEEKRRMLIRKIRIAISENTATKLSVRQINNIAIAIIDYSYQYNITIPRILGQMKQESNFNVNAKSKAGARGLMQIMPKTMEYIELKEGKKLDSWNIYHNIRAGCFYMAEQITDFGNYEEALRAYNWGPNTLRRYRVGELDRDMPQETEKYVPSINKWIKVFEKYGLE